MMREKVAVRPVLVPHILSNTAETLRDKPMICLNLVMRVYIEGILNRGLSMKRLLPTFPVRASLCRRLEDSIDP